MEKLIIHNDESTVNDTLNRTQYAQAFARLAETCGTPLVIGLYGTWGVGKTSLMKLIEATLDRKKTRSIWFDAWRHQFDESPALALLHTMVDTFEMREEGKKLLTVIASAFGSMLLKATTTLSLEDVDKLGKRYEEERFQVREARVRLQEHFKELIEKAQKVQGESRPRIIFFIDDLDRCMPSHTLNMLESLKLYLNLPGCVYFLGVDRPALERSIQYHYKDLELSETRYLDKIVQLPFSIPPIAPESMEEFIGPLLLEELKPQQSLLVRGLGDNPREVKRFINTLTLNHQVASGLSIPEYDPAVLVTLLLIQYRNPSLYRLVARQPDVLGKLKQETEETKSLREEYLARDERLKEAIVATDIPPKEQLARYIYLTQVARVADISRGKADLSSVLSKHKQWVDSAGAQGSLANLRDTDLTGSDLRKANLVKADLSGADMSVSDLSGVNLSKADLSGTNFMGAKLSEANLMEANLLASFLMDANLQKADLGKANLQDTLLMDANLQKANLMGANLMGADLEGANLLEVKTLTIKQLSEVETLYNAKLDPKLLEQIKGKYPHLLEKPKLK